MLNYRLHKVDQISLRATGSVALKDSIRKVVSLYQDPVALNIL